MIIEIKVLYMSNFHSPINRNLKSISVISTLHKYLLIITLTVTIVNLSTCFNNCQIFGLELRNLIKK
ncbi:hypothetical protein HG66A1_62530 [Gimesia chilikensis]|uniref:Uncharacterized protein n=1 Tax=Gimesia chilikensis TaxID=2605989 RepID=A0A517PYG9_9PLAN|nr:hypothetical protein HG66A1_62530 [Gimesia chilikensis]